MCLTMLNDHHYKFMLCQTCFLKKRKADFLPGIDQENSSRLKSMETTMKEVKLEAAETSKAKGSARGISIFDLVLRIAALVGTLGSAVGMGTTDQTLPFFNQFVQFQAQYDDFDTFQLFVIVNAIVSGYLALSLPLSIFHIIKSRATKSRILLILLDTIMLALLTAGASAAAATVYLAHNGNSSANWFAICQQFQDFCQRTSGSLIGSFVAIISIALLVMLSGVALSKHRFLGKGIVTKKNV